MAKDPERPAQETKDIGLKRLKDSWEKTNNRVIPTSQMKKFEDHYVKEILPQVYGK